MKLSAWLSGMVLASQLASGAVIPTAEDTFSSGSYLVAGGGQAGYMQVAPNMAAFTRFEVGSFSGLIAPESVSAARLVIYLSAVTKAGNINLHQVTGDWNEGLQFYKTPPAYQGTPFTTIPANSAITGQYVIVDITRQVKEWLANPAADFGIALTGANGTNVQIASKEGVGFGRAAWIEVDSRPLTGNDQITAGVDAAKLGAGTVSNAEFAFLDGVTAPVQGQIQTLETSIVSAATAAAGKVNRAGDTMTGLLVLPANGLKVGADQLVAADGKVGVGTATPQSKLDVRGNIRFGDAGQHSPVAADEDLRMIRGTLFWNKTTCQVLRGKGFTLSVVSLTNGLTFKLTYDQPFSETPSFVYCFQSIASGFDPVAADQSGITLRGPAPKDGTYQIDFVIVGPR